MIVFIALLTVIFMALCIVSALFGARMHNIGYKRGYADGYVRAEQECYHS